MHIETVAYGGWQRCIRLSDDTAELIITADVGPRIIRYGFLNDINLFVEIPDDMGKTGDNHFRLYGGHRFWHAPEDPARTYLPDNHPVQITPHESFVRVTQPVEQATGLQKELDISLMDGGKVGVVHRLTNHGLWAVETAAWGLSAMKTGGVAVIPMPAYGSHPENLLPSTSLVLWAYTQLADPRWTWGNRYILLRQDTTMNEPQKIGAAVKAGWAAYAVDGRLFVKSFPYVEGAAYPDHGCNFETFTNDTMTEIESLSPLVKLEPGQSVEHVEEWAIYRDVSLPQNDADVNRHILPKIRR